MSSTWNPGSTPAQTSPETAVHLFIPGTAAAPGVGFVGDSGTGFWQPAPGQLDITVSGITQAVIDNIGNFNLAGKVAFSPEQTLIAGATTDIGSVTANSVQITGSNGITSFGTNYKGPMYLRFAGTPTINASSTLLTPGGNNIYVSAGDSCIVTPFSISGSPAGWQIVAYTSSDTTNGGTNLGNRIINGDMRIDQRNNGASQTIGNGYTVDRMYAWVAGGYAPTGQQVAGAGPDQFAYKLTAASSHNPTVHFGQRIEAANIYDLAGQQVTLSAILSGSNPAGTSVGWVLYYPPSVDNWAGIQPVGTLIASGSFNVTAVPQTFYATWTLPAGVQNGLAVELQLSPVNSYTATIAEFSLVAGGSLLPFERKLISEELQRVYRYHQTVSASVAFYGATTGFGYFTPVTYPMQMRATPTVVSVNLSGQTNISTFGASAVTSSSLSLSSIVTAAGNASGLITAVLDAEL